MESINQGEQVIESPEDFAKRLNLPFSDVALLTRALTHRSFLNEHPEALEDNGRLEFLGDAVLDFAVAAWLYNHFPEMREGELTRLRSALVRTEELAEFARQLGIGSALRLGRGEAQAGGRQREATLCGAFEALVGALYLEVGIEAVHTFIEGMFREAVDDILKEHKEIDPKSLLQEWAQKHGLDTPHYRTVSSFGPEHAKVFIVEVIINDHVYGRGTGNSKQQAAKAAAQTALDHLGIG